MTKRTHKKIYGKKSRKHYVNTFKSLKSKWKPGVYSSLNNRQTLKNMKPDKKIKCSANTSEQDYTCYSSKSLHKLKKY